MKLNPKRLFTFSAITSIILNSVAFAEYDNSKVAWGLGSSVDEFNRPTDAITAQQKYNDLQGLFVGSEANKSLWLTFDEGYENGCTADILDTLKEKRVRAVFFITYDYAEKNPDLVRRMIDEGHTVGNHTYSHPSLAECSEQEIREELGKLHEYVRKQFHYDMYVMRPPMGEFSEQVLAIAKEMGYTTVLWSFAYQDWKTDSQPNPDEAFRKLTSKTHNGAVYLLHAVSETNTAILGDVIDYWKNNGYSITPM